MILPICIHFVGHPSIEQVREQKDFCWTNSLVSEDEDVKCRLKLLQKLHDFFAFLVKNTSVYLKNIYQLFLRRWTSEYMVTGYSRKANTSIFATQPLFKSRTFLLEMASLRLLRVPLYIHTFWMFCIWVFPKIGVPQNRWFIMEKKPIRMDDSGGKPTIFGNTHILPPKILVPSCRCYPHVSGAPSRGFTRSDLFRCRLAQFFSQWTPHTNWPFQTRGSV